MVLQLDLRVSLLSVELPIGYRAVQLYVYSASRVFVHVVTLVNHSSNFVVSCESVSFISVSGVSRSSSHTHEVGLAHSDSILFTSTF